MKKLLCLSFLIAVLSSAAEPEAVPNQYIIKLKKDAKSFIAPSVGSGRLVSNLGYAVALVADHDLPKIKKEVEFIEPNYIYRASVAPNDEYQNQLWGMHKIRAWSEITQSAAPIAIIDTGVDYKHPDLAKNILSKGYNAIDGTPNAMDDQGHGTHCAGTIAGVGNNKTGVAGVLWGGKIAGAKFLDKTGAGTTVGAIKAIEWAIQNNYKVLSNSWGGGGYSKALESVIAQACEKNMIFVAAAGNGGPDGHGDNNDKTPQYPANYKLPCVISVAATDQQDKLTEFSNFGKSVHIAAPGFQILSSVPGGAYAAYSGTSMATPHVSGAVAIMLAKNPKLGAKDIILALQNGADPVNLAPCTWYKKFFGSCQTLGGGRLNLERTLKLL